MGTQKEADYGFMKGSEGNLKGKAGNFLVECKRYGAEHYMHGAQCGATPPCN